MSRPRRLGLRREALILLPVSLLLLVLLSTLALFAHRNALAFSADEQRERGRRMARAVAQRLGSQAASRESELRALTADAVGAVVIDSDGTPLLTLGDMPSSRVLDAVDGGLTEATAVGPDREVGDRIAAYAPLGGGRVVRVDLEASALASRLRTATRLLVAVSAVNGAVLVLMLLFIRQLLSPYERMLERARQASAEGAEGADEVAFLVDTFERAVERLAAPREGATDDIAAFEKTVAASFASGVLLLDREGRVLALNDVGAALLGIPSLAPGTPLAEALAIHPELVGLLEGSLGDEAGAHRAECAVGEATLGVTVHPLRRDDRTLSGHLALFADLTDARREAGERQLEESLERLGEVAAGVAHELRNGVATLSGYLSLAARGADGETLADYVEEMQRETRQLERVVEDFLAFARPGTVRLETVELLTLAQRAAKDPALGDTAVEVSGDPIRVRADPQLLERALRNLLSNAARATQESTPGGTVLVTVSGGGGGARLAVEDRGAGIPDEVRDRLFHPFVTGREDGVGLGLSVSRRIATLHGGKLSLSDRDGGGTRAVFDLPPDTIAT